MAINATNRGRLINFINGITGVSPGGNAVVNMPVNQRFHRLGFQCSAVNYTGGTAQTTTAITGSGTGATLTPTIVNGQITAVAIVSGGTGYAVGNTLTINNDATGVGAIFTVATVSSGVIATITVTSGGTPSPIAAATMVTSMKILVNGVNMRDITPDLILRTNIANGQNPALGELDIFFTAPWRNVNQQNEVASWDLFGQATFQLQIQISPSVVNPSLVGVQEFDYLRNVRPGVKANGEDPSKSYPFLNPVAQHSFTWPIVAGRNDINTLPFSFPIARMWLLGSSPGNISQVEVFQDGNKPMETTISQLKQQYQQYGFQFGQSNYLNSNRSTSASLQGQYELPIYYDAAFISDPDQRWWKALKCSNSMILRVYSNVAQSLTIMQETLPGAFNS